MQQDGELVQLAKAGNTEAMAQLYERYAPAIYRYAYTRVGSAEVAEDIQSEVFVRMLEAMPRYEDRGWPLSSWLYRIAHDRVVDMRRRNSVRSLLSLEQYEPSCDGPEQLMGTQLDLEQLYQCMQNLLPDQREVIQLRFVEGLSVAVVAQRLGRSEGSVKALQHRGLQSLARLVMALTA